MEVRALRDAEARCVAEGARFFLAALASGARAHAVGLCRSHCTAAARRAYEQARERGVEHARLTREELLSVSRRPDPDGLIAIVGARARPCLPENCTSQDRWLAFDHIRSPGNLGTLLRSARATGARGAIALSPRVDFLDPAAVRASMGALFELELVSSSPAELAAWARRKHVRIVGASGEAVRDFRKTDWQGPVVLLLGGERRGLSARERELCDLSRAGLRSGLRACGATAAHAAPPPAEAALALPGARTARGDPDGARHRLAQRRDRREPVALRGLPSGPAGRPRSGQAERRRSQAIPLAWSLTISQS